MVTPFGKVLKKYRIDRGITQHDMAVGIGRSSSYLSAMETGKKPVPEQIIENLLLAFQFDEKTRDQLLASIPIKTTIEWYPIGSVPKDAPDGIWLGGYWEDTKKWDVHRGYYYGKGDDRWLQIWKPGFVPTHWAIIVAPEAG